MIHKLYYLRCLVQTAILIVLIGNPVFSQGTDSRKSFSKRDKLSIGINVNPLMTNIANEDFISTTSLNKTTGNSLNYELDVEYFFSKMIGMSLSAGYCSYSSKLTLDSYSTKYQTTDSENETFEMRIKGTSIIENQKLSFLTIPISLILRLPAGEKAGFFIKGGISLDIPVTKTFSGEGTFTYDGYYPEYPILFQDIPSYGFPSNLSTVNSGTLEIKSLNISFCASGGAYFYLNEKIQIVFGAHYNKSLTNISAYTRDPDFRLTSKANELNSVMAGSTKVSLQAVGLSIGIKYFLGK